MRLWSLHPAYLDSKGLVALWREALLAQAVLQGKTKGYTRHPQLLRFLEHRASVGAIAQYLRAVHREASHRGYRFDASRISRCRTAVRLTVTRGQIEHERRHLLRKLEARNPEWRTSLARVKIARAHPLFTVVRGRIEKWEKASTKKGKPWTARMTLGRRQRPG